MNKNIFVYVGTSNLNTRTYRYTKRIISLLENKFETTIPIHTPNNLKLDLYEESKKMFQTGIIQQDFIDDGVKLKTKLSEADIIILATPVHSHNVSVSTKMLIDRIAHWGHIFKLIGKNMVTINTSESNGSQLVSDYLKKIFANMGAHIIFQAEFINSEPELTDQLIHKTIDKISKSLTDEIKFEISPIQERNFQVLKLIISEYPKDNYEYKYWLNNGLLSVDSLVEWMER